MKKTSHFLDVTYSHVTQKLCSLSKSLTCNCVLECMKNEGTFFNFEWLAQRIIWIDIDNHKLKSMNLSNSNEKLAIDIFSLYGMCKWFSWDQNVRLTNNFETNKNGLRWMRCCLAFINSCIITVYISNS